MGLSVEYEKADQRRHHRLTAPLFVRFNGTDYRASDWSLGGLRLEGIRSDLPDIGDRVGVTITLPYQDFKISFEAELEIVRHVERGFGAKFTRLGEREQGLMSHFIEEIVRGSMVDVKDTIARMDVPVTPVSMQPPAAPASGTPLRRWTSRAVVVPALYALAGVLVFGYAALAVYSNVFQLVVETAVVGDRAGIVKALSDGEISHADVKVGDVVPQGTIVAQITDPVLEAKIGRALVEIKRRQSEQELARRQFKLLLSRIRQHVLMKSGNLQARKRELANLQRQHAHLARRYRRLQRELKRQRTRRKTVDTALAALLRVRTRRDKLRSELAMIEKFANGRDDEMDYSRLAEGGAVGSNLIFDGKRVIDDIPREKARLDYLQGEVELAREDYQVLVRQRERAVVRAPFDSHIVDLPRIGAGTVLRGDVIAVFAPQGTHMVTAYLTQKEVLKVRGGDRATIFVPALGKSVTARIRTINRQFAFVNERSQLYSPRPKQERNARVILEISPEDDEIAGQLSPGLPAIVRFADRQPGRLFGSFWPGS